MGKPSRKFSSGLSFYLRRSMRGLFVSGYPLSSNTACIPFFIVGSGRSGTTLLRRILTFSGDIHIPPETQLAPLIRLYREHAHLKWDHLVYLTLAYIQYRRDRFDYSMSPLALELRHVRKDERSFATILTRFYAFDAETRGITFTRWGDKTPQNYTCMPEILKVFPDARFVHIYRDGCDVVRSYVKNEIVSDYTQVAHAWVDSIESCRTFGAKHPERYHEIQYEQLVAEPKKTVPALCDFLDIPFEEGMVTQSHTKLDGLFEEEESPAHANLKQPISTNNVGRGRAELSDEERSNMAPIMDATLEKLGYERCVGN